jgi:hypothetical protein
MITSALVNSVVDYLVTAEVAKRVFYRNVRL